VAWRRGGPWRAQAALEGPARRPAAVRHDRRGHIGEKGLLVSCGSTVHFEVARRMRELPSVVTFESGLLGEVGYYYCLVIWLA
jgi:hypothetical protein